LQGENVTEKSTDNIITCQDAAFGYDGRIVIRNMSFTVKRGAYLCIIGENGCGKSTLLKGILRLVIPLEGRLDFSPELRAKGTGYLAQQEAAKKDFPASAAEIVLSGFAGKMGLRPFYSRSEKEAALENMRRLKALHLKDRCFRELSGGQQRRVLIARALSAAGSLLALDEPAAGLDPAAAAALYELLAAINRESGMTIISVTHNTEQAACFASHILHIKDGQYFFGTLAEYTQSEAAGAFFHSFSSSNGGNKND
jgi:zinc transport system ATP-binding protein